MARSDKEVLLDAQCRNIENCAKEGNGSFRKLIKTGSLDKQSSKTRQGGHCIQKKTSKHDGQSTAVSYTEWSRKRKKWGKI